MANAAEVLDRPHRRSEVVPTRTNDPFDDLAPRYFEPGFDLRDAGTCFRLIADVPGVDAADLDIVVRARVITIRGRRSARSVLAESGHELVRERSYGSFERRFPLPESVDGRGLCAFLSKGVLRLDLPKGTMATAAMTRVRVAEGSETRNGW